MRATSTVMFLIVILMVAFNTRLVFTQSTTIIVPDDFSTIQEAVNAANPGDTVYVRAGTYQEIVMINKNNLVLTGESKHTTIIDGSGGTNRTVLVDNADNVEISGFTIQNSHDGIYIYDSSFSTVSGNIITTCSFRGIILSSPNITDVSQAPVNSNGTLEDGAKVNATVTDTLSGVERVALNYTNDNGIWVIAEMANLEGDIWNGTLPAFPHGTNVTYTIIAEDKAGNTITTEDLFGYPNQYQVLPEFPSWIILPLFLTVTLMVTIYKKKLTKTAIPRSY